MKLEPFGTWDQMNHGVARSATLKRLQEPCSLQDGLAISVAAGAVAAAVYCL